MISCRIHKHRMALSDKEHAKLLSQYTPLTDANFLEVSVEVCILFRDSYCEHVQRRECHAHHNCFLRQAFFDEVVERIIANIVDEEWEE